MKKYRIWIPIVLIVLTVVSWYTVISQSASLNSEYNAYLDAARKAAENTITVDVEAQYAKALNIKSTEAVYLEWGQYYFENELYESAVNLGELMIDVFPDSSEVYAYLLSSYLQTNNYDDFFSEYKYAQKNGIVNEEINEMYLQNQFAYKIDYNSYIDCGIFSSSLSPVSLKSFDDEAVYYGYANENGEVDINAVYLSCGYFNNDDTSIAPVVNKEGEAYYIDQNGNKKIVISPENITVKKLGMYSSDVLSVYDGENYYLCDIDSKVIGGPYKYLSTVNSGIGIIEDDDGWKIIDNMGAATSDIVFEGFALDEKEIAFRENCLFAKENGKYYLVDKTGNKISDTAFDDAKIFVDSYAAVEIDGKWGYINNSGEIVIECAYQDANSFSNGLGAVCKDNLWGYITFDLNTNESKIAIDYSFFGAQNFSQTSNCAFVKIDDSWKLIQLYF